MTVLTALAAPTVLAGITTQITSAVAHHGAYAIFGLMALDALLPVGGELIMLYAGVLAAGAISGLHASLFGAQLASGAESYVILALTGALGYLAGSLAGWGIGAAGGQPLIERHGRWMHLPSQAFDRDERWFERYRARRVPQPHHPGRTVLHLHPRRGPGQPARALHPAHAARPADLVLRVRRGGLGARRNLGDPSTTTSATPTTPP